MLQCRLVRVPLARQSGPCTAQPYLDEAAHVHTQLRAAEAGNVNIAAELQADREIVLAVCMAAAVRRLPRWDLLLHR